MADLLSFSVNKNPLSITQDQMVTAPKAHNTTVAISNQPANTHKWENIARTVAEGANAAANVMTAIREDNDLKYKAAANKVFTKFQADNAKYKTVIAAYQKQLTEAPSNPTIDDAIKAKGPLISPDDYNKAVEAMQPENYYKRAQEAHQETIKLAGNDDRYIAMANNLWGSTIMNATDAVTKKRLNDAKNHIIEVAKTSIHNSLISTDPKGNANILSTIENLKKNPSVNAYFKAVGATEDEKNAFFSKVFKESLQDIQYNYSALKTVKNTLEQAMESAGKNGKPIPSYLRDDYTTALRYYKQQEAIVVNQKRKEAGSYINNPDFWQSALTNKTGYDFLAQKAYEYYGGKTPSYYNYMKRLDSSRVQYQTVQYATNYLKNGIPINLDVYKDKKGVLKPIVEQFKQTVINNIVSGKPIDSKWLMSPTNVKYVKEATDTYLTAMKSQLNISDPVAVQTYFKNTGRLYTLMKDTPGAFTESTRKELNIVHSISKYLPADQAVSVYTAYKTGDTDLTKVHLPSNVLKDLDDANLGSDYGSAITAVKLLVASGVSTDNADDLIDGFKGKELDSGVSVNNDVTSKYPDTKALDFAVSKMFPGASDGKLTIADGTLLYKYKDDDGFPHVIAIHNKENLDKFNAYYEQQLEDITKKERDDALHRKAIVDSIVPNDSVLGEVKASIDAQVKAVAHKIVGKPDVDIVKEVGKHTQRKDKGSWSFLGDW